MDGQSLHGGPATDNSIPSEKEDLRRSPGGFSIDATSIGF